MSISKPKTKHQNETSFFFFEKPELDQLLCIMPRLRIQALQPGIEKKACKTIFSCMLSISAAFFCEEDKKA